ncbi:MAG: metallophosphatase domain-containing protein [Planctomycetota bacterium]|nr:metallophosphatase domain-containing protein [Planctomycetota bacterium]
MRLVCLSDTHGMEPEGGVPPGDVLVHAGDLTTRGTRPEVEAAHAWLAALPHRHKVVVAGNHDWAFERDATWARATMTGVTYLEDAEALIDGIRFWGSPWQPWFFDWAFNLQRGAELAAKWAQIPDGVDVLITHGPPAGHGDVTWDGRGVGCADLLEAVQRVRPRVHVFGHIHEGYGTTESDGTTFINASTCDLRYRPVNPPIVYELV